MLDILILLSPVFLLTLIGALAVWFDIFPRDGLPFLYKFVLNICVPVMIFSAVSRSGSLDQLNWGFIFAYAGASLVLILIARILLRYARGFDAAQSWMLSMGSATSNSIFVGFPVAIMVLPANAERWFSWVLVAENLIIIPLVMVLADVHSIHGEAGNLARIRQTLRSIIRNPVVIGLGAGLAFAASGLDYAEPFERIRGTIVAAAPFLALFVIGGTVATVKAAQLSPVAGLIAMAKLVIHPVLVWVCFALLLDLPRELAIGATLFAAMPIVSAFPIFASRHQAAPIAASALVASTVAAAVTIPFALVLLGMG